MMISCGLRDIVLVVNETLPPGDYRVQFANLCQKWRVLIAMPGKAKGISEEQHVPFPFREGVHLGDIVVLWKLWLYLRTRRKRIALVHFFSTELVLFGPLVARLAGVPSLTTVTGLGRVFNDGRVRYRLLRGVYRVLLRLSGRCASAMLFQNMGDMKEVEKWLGREVRYIGSAVSGEVVAAKAPRNSQLQVLLVSRLLPSKGIEDFIQVARALHDKGIRFVLVGPPSSGSVGLYQQVLRANEEGVLEYLGELHGAELQAAYLEADVFLFLSYGEGLPRVMLEAGLACCCPVAYAINANRELVFPDGGVLVPIGDTDGAASAVMQLARDRKCVERNAKQFQSLVIARYSMDAYCSRLYEAYSTVVQEVEENAGSQVPRPGQMLP